MHHDNGGAARDWNALLIRPPLRGAPALPDTPLRSSRARQSRREKMSHPDLQEESWDISRGSSRCPLCAPREPNNEYRLEIASLSISTLYLFRDQRFRGYSLLTFDRRQAATAIRSALKPDHMNYECLGNTSPHLHWHIVPRFKHDPRWGQPIWEGWQRNEFNLHRLVLTDAEYAEIIERVRTSLGALKT